jgi:D-sedoheptulose 7-phosphate isomerase
MTELADHWAHEGSAEPKTRAAQPEAPAARPAGWGAHRRDRRPRGGYTAKVADAAVVTPTVSADPVTPHTEALQTVVWHLIVSHPALKRHEIKWESVV